MYAVIFSGGQIEDGFFVRQAIKNADSILAADSGVETALEWHTRVDVVVGDLDSLSTKTVQNLKQKGITFFTHDREKDQTDTQLAVDLAVKKGATEIIILGGVQGNRIDHVMANVMLSAYALNERNALRIKQKAENIQIFFINGNQKSWIIKGPKKEIILGKKGDLLSLIPLSEKVIRIQTKNLQYALNDESLFFGNPRGISNVLLSARAEVRFQKGRLLFVHTHTII